MNWWETAQTVVVLFNLAALARLGLAHRQGKGKKAKA